MFHLNTRQCNVDWSYVEDSREDMEEIWVVCNPATGEFLTLPELLLKDEATIEGFYFGYDPINKQFKVLCMTSSNTHRVLTLENGKRKWRKSESGFDFKEIDRIRGEICINGVLYFGAWIHQSFAVVCFDVRSEKFNVIYIGNDMIKRGPYAACAINLIKYRGKIGIHESRKRWRKLDFDLIVLEDAGNHKWSKHSYEFPPSWNSMVDENKLHIIGMTDTCEMVFAPFWLSNPFYVFYYNFENNIFTRVAIQGFEEFSHEKNISDTFRGYREKTRIDTFLDYGRI